MKEKLTPYQRKLFLFLGVATFFEGYDFIALTQLLPNLRQDMNLPAEASAYIMGVVNIGTILAFLAGAPRRHMGPQPSAHGDHRGLHHLHGALRSRAQYLLLRWCTAHRARPSYSLSGRRAWSWRPRSSPRRVAA